MVYYGLLWFTMVYYGLLWFTMLYYPQSTVGLLSTHIHTNTYGYILQNSTMVDTPRVARLLEKMMIIHWWCVIPMDPCRTPKQRNNVINGRKASKERKTHYYANFSTERGFTGSTLLQGAVQ